VAVPPADDDGRALSARLGAPSRRRAVVTAALAVALLTAAAGLGLVLWERRGQADDVQAERERVMAQAEQFLLRIGTFGPEMLEGAQMPEFREQVAEVLTPKAVEEFEQQVVVAEQLVSQQQASRTAEVFGTGVATIDDDSATALVAGSFTNTVQDRAGAPFPVYLRLELVQVEGEWLVDDFASAIEDQDDALPGQGGAPPTGQDPQPSGGATP
jgi:Mce-associated membrane protein